MTAKTKKIRFVSEGFVLNVEVRNKLGEQVLGMCKTIDDVQRCAGMGDFEIKSWDLPAA